MITLKWLSIQELDYNSNNMRVSAGISCDIKRMEKTFAGEDGEEKLQQAIGKVILDRVQSQTQWMSIGG